MYQRYKTYKNAHFEHDDYAPQQLSMIAQITLTLLPASLVLIFLPSFLFTYFEGWPYSVSVYYSFVTLSTIGFGDFIPTFQPHQVRVIDRMDKIVAIQCFLNYFSFLFWLMHAAANVRNLFPILPNIRIDLVYFWIGVHFDAHRLHSAGYAKQANCPFGAAPQPKYYFDAQSHLERCNEGRGISAAHSEWSLFDEI